MPSSSDSNPFDPLTVDPPPSEPPEPLANPTETSWARAWMWVPTLYFVQGLPYVIVNNLSVVMYKTLAVSNTAIAFYTSWLGLVWAFKALWSPFVDGTSTKRRWTLAMQAAMAPTLVLMAFALPLPSFFQLTLALFFVVAILSATHDIAADGLYMLGLSDDQQAAFVGVRSTFWRIALISGEGGLVVLAGSLGRRYGLVEGWSITLCVAAAVFGLGSLYHFMILPRPAIDVARPSADALGNSREIIRSFFAKPQIGASLLFLLFFRFGENHMAKMVSPFLIDDRGVGGLGLSLEEVGIAKGTAGVAALVVGGILGGVAIWRHGLKAWLWPMVIAINAPNLVYVYLAWFQPESYPLVTGLIAVESFGYGFGFAAYMMFMIQFAQGDFKTAHYAFGTGVMALAVSAAQFWSGAIQEMLGYDWFFVWVLVLALPAFFVVWLVDVPPEFGRRKSA